MTVVGIELIVPVTRHKKETLDIANIIFACALSSLPDSILVLAM